MVASLLLALPLVAAPARLAGESDGADQGRPVVLKRHSIAAFAEPLRPAMRELPLLPLRERGQDLIFGGGELEPLPLLDPDAIVDLIRTVVEPASWESEAGWRIERREPGDLFVVAPAETQARIGELLDTLERDLLPSERLEIRLLPGGPSTSTGGALLVDRAAADRRIAERGAARFASARLRDRIAVGGETGEVHDYTSDWEIDVADGMSIASPQRYSWLEGLRFVARATRVEGGALVDLLVQATDAVAATESVAIDSAALYNVQATLLPRSAVGRIDEPRVGFVTFAGTLLLPDGSDLLVPVAVKSAWGMVEWTLDLRCELGGSKPTTVIEPIARAEGGPLRLAIRRSPAAALGSIAFERGGYESSDLRDFFAQRQLGWSAILGDPPPLEVEQALATGAIAELLERDPAAQIRTVGSSGHLLTLLPPAESDAVSRSLAVTSALDAGATLRGRVKVGGELRAEFAAPLFVGRRVALWAGVETRLLRRWNCEIAKEAASPEPKVEGCLDGVALRFRLLKSSRGDLLLDVDGSAQLFAAVPALADLGGATSHAIQPLRANVLGLDERVTFGPRGGSATLGGDVTLELELVPH